MNETSETGLRMDVFEKFVLKYRDRYKDKMGADTASMFFDKLAHIDSRQFQEVTEWLLGSSKFAFGWVQVLERHDMIYPSAQSQQALDTAWKLEHDKNPHKDKRRILSNLLATMPLMVKNNKGDWRSEYFKKLMDILGEQECVTIATNIQYLFPEFKNWLYARKKVL